MASSSGPSGYSAPFLPKIGSPALGMTEIAAVEFLER